MDINPKSGLNGKNLVKIDPELREIVPSFIKNRHKDVLEMPEFLKKSDYKAIERVGHGMKGSGSGFGFDVISNIGARLEKASKEKNADDISNCIGELSRYMEHLEISYE